MKFARSAMLVEICFVFTLAIVLAGCSGGGGGDVSRSVSQTGVPNISNVVANVVSPTSVTITWTTDTATTSQVDFGTTVSYGSSSPTSSSMVTSHSVTLTSLTSGVTYHFR